MINLNCDHLYIKSKLYKRMIVKRFPMWISERLMRSFATTKGKVEFKKQSSIFSKNENMKFQDQNYDITMSPMYPQLVKRTSDSFQIYPNSIIFYWKFSSKQNYYTEVPLSKQQHLSSEPEDLSFSFTYSNLVSLLEVEPNSGTQSFFQRQKIKNSVKWFDSIAIKDWPEKAEVNLRLWTTTIQQKQNILGSPSKLEFKFSYLHYRVVHILLQKCLYDLSGSHLVQELKRLQDLQEVTISPPQYDI